MFKKQDGMLAFFLCTVPAVFLPKFAKKQNEMLAFFAPKNSIPPIFVYCVVGFLSKYV